MDVLRHKDLVEQTLVKTNSRVALAFTRELFLPVSNEGLVMAFDGLIVTFP